MGTELVQLRPFYAEPGFVLVATVDGAPVGCVALRSIEPGIAEVRRLFVSAGDRSAGRGRRLMARLTDEARVRGIERLVLETLPTMVHARALYRDLGFRPIDPYTADPTPGVIHLGTTV